MVPYPNSGEPVWRDLKGRLWRVEKEAWIETGIKGHAFRLLGAPDPDTGERRLAARLTDGGTVVAYPGLILDGSSVPLLGRYLDNKVSGWPSTVHDVVYEAIRTRHAPLDLRIVADALYRDMLREFGAWSITANACYVGLRIFGASAASPDRGSEYSLRRAA